MRFVTALSLSLSASTLLPSALAVAVPEWAKSSLPKRAWKNYCSITDNSDLKLPPNQQNITLPDPKEATVLFVTIGVGVQNYTCIDSKWTSSGALATMYDISPLLWGEPSDFQQVQDRALEQALLQTNLTNRLPFIPVGPLYNVHGVRPWPLGDHFFIPNTPSSSPTWDFTSALKDPELFTVAALKGSTPDPRNPDFNVAWLELNAVEGELSTIVFRVDTFKGQPPKEACEADTALSVPYSAKYWFFNKPC